MDSLALAAAKQLESSQTQEEWLRAIENARQSLKVSEVKDSHLEWIVLACPSTKQLTMMIRLIYQHGTQKGRAASSKGQVSDLIFHLVNGSPYSLRDWINALDRFNHWMEAQGRKSDLISMLNYLECCAASAEGKNKGQLLSEVLEIMLQLYGYVG